MPAAGELQRLRFLARVAVREATHLQRTDARLFAQPFSTTRARLLETDFDLAERVEAFVSRFSRLQHTLGDKLLPLLLRALGETPAAAIDNWTAPSAWVGLHQPTNGWQRGAYAIR